MPLTDNVASAIQTTPRRPPVATRAGAKASGLPDFAEFNLLVGAIYQGAMESPPWQTALQLWRDSLQASHVTLMLRPPSPENVGVMINTGSVTAQGVESYETHFFALDPFVRLTEGDVVSAEEVLGKQWLQSTVYQDYLKPLDVRHLLGADIYTKDGIECRLRITRGHDAQPFSEADKDLCRLLLPHLKRSIQLHAQLDFLECERALFAGAVNRLQLGMVSFDQNGVVLETNPEARRILNEKDGIWLTGNNLCLDNSQESRDLQRMLRQAMSGATHNEGPGMIEAMPVTRPSGRAKLGVLIKAVPMGEPQIYADWERDFAGAMALLADSHTRLGGGGSGHRFEWSQLPPPSSRQRPLMLAGGLTPETVGDAIRNVRPWAVDVSSGIESGTKGVKDHRKMRAFVDAEIKPLQAQDDNERFFDHRRSELAEDDARLAIRTLPENFDRSRIVTVIETIVLFTAVLYMFCNLVADILYAALNPLLGAANVARPPPKFASNAACPVAKSPVHWNARAGSAYSNRTRNPRTAQWSAWSDSPNSLLPSAIRVEKGADGQWQANPKDFHLLTRLSTELGEPLR